MIRIFWSLALTGLVLVGCGRGTEKDVYVGVLEGKSVKVSALVAGRLERLLVDTGDRVAKGDTLAIMDTLELSLQRQQLMAAREEAQIQLRIARQQLQQAAKDLQYAKTQYERIRLLYEQNTVPQQKLDEAENRLNRVRTGYANARNQVARLEAALRRIGVQLKTVQKKLNDAVILSPSDGVIASRYFETGEAVAPFQPVVEVLYLDEMEIRVYIAEPDLPAVRLGQKAEIRIDGRDEPFTGTVVWISPRAEFSPKTILTPSTRTSLVYAVKIRVPNRQGILKHGMPAEVVLR